MAEFINNGMKSDKVHRGAARKTLYVFKADTKELWKTADIFWAAEYFGVDRAQVSVIARKAGVIEGFILSYSEELYEKINTKLI